MVGNRSRRSRDENKEENKTKSSSLLAISLLDVFALESEQQSSLIFFSKQEHLNHHC